MVHDLEAILWERPVLRPLGNRLLSEMTGGTMTVGRAQSHLRGRATAVLGPLSEDLQGAGGSRASASAAQ